MTPRAFLVRGLLAGLVAGLATFGVAQLVGEPHLERAIALEEAGAATSGSHSHAESTEGESTHAHEEGSAVVVSRDNQSTWGLLTGSLAVGVALGGLVALVAAGTLGRIGPLLPGQSTALVSLIGFVSVALVPFLKYPANPPGVGSGETIGDRTVLYFVFLMISIAAAVLATYAACKLRDRLGTYACVVGSATAYLVIVVVAGQVFATVNEVSDFPGDLLWSFRISSLVALTVMWGVLGVVLVGLVSRLHDQQRAVLARRELAASL
ncbi:CbtA family protein [Nocardioides sp.]|uniref:CbtA family protein n=1 Tax=Nocardioides sp. TaxID=35761 RepID=UPI002C78F206|nr:CbtA family protein [Nocardioides sp.]HXH79447.1 CbtA family protein [Nocardioides sp.]